MLLITEAVVTDISEAEKAPSLGAAPGMGDMY